MITTIQFNDKQYQADLSKPLDIAIPIHAGEEQVNCFYAPPVQIKPVEAGDFIGSTEQGGLVNFYNLHINPHGNGTHTECVGHIAKPIQFIRTSLLKFHYIARVITITPEAQSTGDQIIHQHQLEQLLSDAPVPEAVVIRTLPNGPYKTKRNYSGSNPPYLHYKAAEYLAQQNVQHLLLDLPSVDREEDEGKLAAHKAFWHYPESPRSHCTITELIYVPDDIQDDFYLLNLQVLSLDLDASPSKPVLYALKML